MPNDNQHARQIPALTRTGVYAITRVSMPDRERYALEAIWALAADGSPIYASDIAAWVGENRIDCRNYFDGSAFTLALRHLADEGIVAIRADGSRLSYRLAQEQCRAHAPNIWPPVRCGEATGHGRAHQSSTGVYWIGPEPPAEGEAA